MPYRKISLIKNNNSNSFRWPDYFRETMGQRNACIRINFRCRYQLILIVYRIMRIGLSDRYETPGSFSIKIYEIECSPSADENNPINIYIFEIRTIRATRQYQFYIWSEEKEIFWRKKSSFFIIKYHKIFKLMQLRRN